MADDDAFARRVRAFYEDLVTAVQAVDAADLK